MRPRLDPIHTAETIVGASVSLRGELQSPGDVHVDGEIFGNVTADGDISIGRTGRVEGNLSGHNISISGIVRGDILAGDKCELRYSGQLQGDISCQTLEVHAGGQLRGAVTMQEPAAELEESPGTEAEEAESEHVEQPEE